jgi:hypothetical protein
MIFQSEARAEQSVESERRGNMQCPGPPCDLGPHCWRDPLGKKHFKLRTHHLRALVDFVGQGNALQSHDDVPEHIREQLCRLGSTEYV